MLRSTLARLVLPAAAAALLAACASTPLDEGKGAPIENRSTTGDTTAAPAASTAPPAATAAPAVARVEATTPGADPLKDATGPLARREVFFEFDSFEVKAEYAPMLEAHARLLVADQGRSLRIEGHADERGSREYNLALGQKRADAVKSRLRVLGVAEAQVETVSFGEERPRAAGKTEADYAQNRRADLNYLR